MRSTGNFHPQWGYLAPSPSFARTLRVALVATAVGATAGAGVAVSLIGGPAATESSKMVEPSVTAAAMPSPAQGYRPSVGQIPATAPIDLAKDQTNAVPATPSLEYGVAIPSAEKPANPAPALQRSAALEEPVPLPQQAMRDDGLPTAAKQAEAVEQRSAHVARKQAKRNRIAVPRQTYYQPRQDYYYQPRQDYYRQQYYPRLSDTFPPAPAPPSAYRLFGDVSRSR